MVFSTSQLLHILFYSRSFVQTIFFNMPQLYKRVVVGAHKRERHSILFKLSQHARKLPQDKMTATRVNCLENQRGYKIVIKISI